jgi:hypothetical protein
LSPPSAIAVRTPARTHTHARARDSQAKAVEKAEAEAELEAEAAREDAKAGDAPLLVTLDRGGGKKMGIILGHAEKTGAPVPIAKVDPSGQAAGTLVPGDGVTHVNGTSVLGMTKSEAASVIMGGPELVVLTLSAASKRKRAKLKAMAGASIPLSPVPITIPNHHCRRFARFVCVA